MRHLDDFCLPVNRRSRITVLGTTIVVERDTFDDRVNRVTVRQRVGKSLEHDGRDAFAENGTASFFIEGSDVTIGRKDHTFFGKIAVTIFQIDADRSSQRHVALVGLQSLTSELHGDQRCRASGLNGHARPDQVHSERDAGRKEIFLVANQCLKRSRRIKLVHGAMNQLTITVGASTSKDSDATIGSRWIVTRILQSGPCIFEKQAVLRIGDSGFVRTDSEKFGVEHFHAVQRSRYRHVTRIANFLQWHIGRQEFCFAQSPNRFHSAFEVVPELVDRVGSGETSCHPDNRNRLIGVDVVSGVLEL